MLLIYDNSKENRDHHTGVRTVRIRNEKWYVGTDVAAALGYESPATALQQHCQEQGTLRHNLPELNKGKETLLINEENLIRLII